MSRKRLDGGVPDSPRESVNRPVAWAGWPRAGRLSFQASLNEHMDPGESSRSDLSLPSVTNTKVCMCLWAVNMVGAAVGLQGNAGNVSHAQQKGLVLGAFGRDTRLLEKRAPRATGW